MANLILSAPLAGWATPLDEVPDEVFAARMLGDGLAIDPTNCEARAPCAGAILAVHAAGHAVSLRAACGAEILVHIGLETVALAGEGFVAHVRPGEEVAAGALLIAFDMDLVARRAASLMSPIILANGEAFAIVRRVAPGPVEAGGFLMEIASVAGAAPAEGSERIGEAAGKAVVPLAHGLHARPAARIAAEARRFASKIRLSGSGGEASAVSTLAVMALGAGEGETLAVTATGPDAQAAVEAIVALIEHGLAHHEAAAAAPGPASPPVVRSRPGVLAGLPAAPGLAIGAAHRLRAPEIGVAASSGSPDLETAALSQALDAVRSRLAKQAARGPPDQREILGAHLAIVDDEGLTAAAASAIAAGASAGAAWRAAMEAQADALRRLADPRLSQRAADLVDLERQVLVALGGEAAPAPEPPPSAIVLAHDLLPSQVMALPSTIAGLGVAQGGPTSHVAILAAARGIPAVVAAGAGVMEIADGASLILDGDAGLITVAPTAAELEAAQSRLADRRSRKSAAVAQAAADCRTADGTRIEVFANLGSLEEASAAVIAGAEGCGLLRTEFLFLGRANAPGEDEQARRYQAIATALRGRPLIIRTLDVGGDKAVPYLAMPTEENPALGVRGIRVGLRRPDLLRAQIRAILRIRPSGQARIMVPMVASLSEFLAVRAMVEEARASLLLDAPIEVGVMVETPAAAVGADLLARHADFLSVGSNDLTQYALAMDRGNPALASQVDALHPAVLRLIGQAVAGARPHGRMVGVCGALAGDGAAAAILVGLGVRELSMPPPAIAEMKALVRTLHLADCEEIARAAQALEGAAEVRALAAASHPGEAR